MRASSDASLAHTRLPVWQTSLDLAAEAYAVSDRLPDDERYGLASQMRRAAVSIPANIAEGSSLRTRAQLVRHLVIARGSAVELTALAAVAVRVGRLEEGQTPHLVALARRVCTELTWLVRKLESTR